MIYRFPKGDIEDLKFFCNGHHWGIEVPDGSWKNQLSRELYLMRAVVHREQ